MNDPWRSRITGHGEEDPSQLLANPRNWRIHPKAQQDALTAVLDRVGWVQDVIVNKTTGHVLDGHLRVGLAISREEESIPVVYVELTEDEEALILATFDPLGALAGTDDEILRSLVSDIGDQPPELAALLDELVDTGPTPGKTDPDAVPDVPEEPITKPGDLWILDDHRLPCGDATSELDHDRLLDGTSVDLCLTDPPYGVGIEYESFVDSADAVKALVERFMPLLLRWPRSLITSGVRLLSTYPPPDWILAWVHPAGTGLGPWGFTTFKPILAYGEDPYLHAGKGARPDSIVKAANRAGFNGHPVSKPVDVWCWLLERGSVTRGETVLDPFVGSGTTIIAAEQLGRKCYAMEIEPKYVDVCVNRWEDFTGRKAKRSRKRDP